MSVLENHHCTTLFTLMKKEFNILSEFSTEEYKKFRSIIIESILCTDMTKHNDKIKEF